MTAEYQNVTADRTLPAGRGLAFESYILAAICIVDLVTTVFWVSYRNASEANPVMEWYLRAGGTGAFVLMKMLLCAFPLFVAEWARRSRPHFVRNTLRFAIVAYIALYGIGVIHVNDAAAAREQTRTQAVQSAPVAASVDP